MQDSAVSSVGTDSWADPARRRWELTAVLAFCLATFVVPLVFCELYPVLHVTTSRTSSHGTPSSYHRGGTWRIERPEVRHRTIREALDRGLPEPIIGTWKPEESAAATITDFVKSSARRATSNSP